MKIGVFDSGLGGLIILRSIVKKLPQYDYLYLGDTKRLPYGERDPETIYRWTCQAVKWLFKHDCQLVIVACNTASAQALRRLQQTWLPKHYPDRRVLGVIVPTVEAVAEQPVPRVGVLATRATARSHVYKKELRKLAPRIKVSELAAPQLVPFIENRQTALLNEALKKYLRKLLQHRPKALVLGCTHYPLVKAQVRRLVGRKILVISQDEIIPKKVADYLRRHPELKTRLSRGRKRQFFVTSKTRATQVLSQAWFGRNIRLKPARLP